jgi:putative hydrolase of the HAD superfamily
MTPIRTIFFDFGNVIAFFNHQRAVEQLVPFSDRPAAELTLQLYGGELETLYEKGQISTTSYVNGAIRDGRLKCDADQFLRAFVDIFWPNPAIVPVIEKLSKRYRLVLASNTNDAHFEFFRVRFEPVLKHFFHLGTSHRAGARKPERPFFEFCQRFADGEPHECLFIDDLTTNIEAAIQFGWHGIVYADHAEFLRELARFGIEGIDDE